MFFVFRGPETIMKNMATKDQCEKVGKYNNIYNSMSLDERVWLKSKSVCNGLASIGSDVIIEWPCWWESTRPELIVNSIDYVSPGISMGGTIDATE